MPFDATNTNLVPFHISTCWYLTAYTCDDLHVFQTDPSCLQQPLDKFLSLIDVFRQAVVAEQCDMRFFKSIRKQRFYTSLNVVVHYFFA